jgi:hypothetical protein
MAGGFDHCSPQVEFVRKYREVRPDLATFPVCRESFRAPVGVAPCRGKQRAATL